MDSSNSTPEGCSSASSLRTSGSDDSTDQSIINGTLPSLSHLKEIVIRRFIELKAILLIESRGISLLEITHTTVHHHPPAGYVHCVLYSPHVLVDTIMICKPCSYQYNQV